MGGVFVKIKNHPVTYVAVAALLIAAEVVLNRFCSINTMGLKIGFAFIPPTLAAIMYGPGMSAAVWGLSDLLGAILFPIGPYHPGFTACAVLMGLVSGFFRNENPVHVSRQSERGSFVFEVSRKKIRIFPHVVVPVLINCLVLGLTVNTAWVSMLYGSKTYGGWFLYRLGEYAVMVPVQIILVPALVKLGEVINKSTGRRKTG